jgi:hypothetical protein
MINIECQLNGHDWYRPLKENGRRSGHKKCWRCGKNTRSQLHRFINSKETTG